MFERILLPVDLTEQSRRSVEAAVHLLGDAGGTIILLHVIETIADADFEEMQGFYKRLEDKARLGLQALAEPLGGTDIGVEQQIVYGKRAREIIQFAEDNGVELILMTSRRLDSEDPEATWGSISHQVAILAGCPVLLLK